MCWLRLWTTHLLLKFWFTYFFSHVHFKKKNNTVHERSFLCPETYATWKLIFSWIHCTLTRKPNIGNIWKHFEGTTNQLARKVWWHMLKISKFCQTSTFHHPTSSTLLSNWPDPSWIHWHLIIKNNFSIICTYFGTSISFCKRLWSISWRIWCFF
jgi:hypothetical protein